VNVWLRLSATFHEHPKMLMVRDLAGPRADSAELGWYRILMAAKRYGRWTFASEEHLSHIAGAYYRYIDFYRRSRLLDDLTVHDGDNYNAIKTDSERKAEQRERDKVSRRPVTPQRDQSVTLDDRQTEKTEKTDIAGDRDSLDTYHELTLYRPWGVWSGDKLKAAINDYGDPAVDEALRQEAQLDGDRSTLLDRTLARLARNADRAREVRKSKPRVVPIDEAERRRVEIELRKEPA
jgi:hypothetical protein